MNDSVIKIKLSDKFVRTAENVPLNEIGLSTRAQNLLLRAGAKNSLDATKLILSNFHQLEGAGAQTLSESRALITKFINKIETASDDAIQQLMPRHEHGSVINNEELIEKARKVPIASIGLPTRAVNILLEAGAQNSFDAISIVLSGFSGTRRVGAKTAEDSKSAVQDFIEELENMSDGTMSRFSDVCDVQLSALEGNLVTAFPKIVKLYLSKAKDKVHKRNQDILYKNYGIEGCIESAETVATTWNITGKRVRQIRLSAVKDLQQILSGNVCDKDWHLCPKILDSFKTVQERLNEFDWLIKKNHAEEILSELFGEMLPSAYFDFLMEVLGYVKLPNPITRFKGTTCELWGLVDKYNKKEIESFFMAFNEVFNSPQPTQLDTLFSSLESLNISADKRSEKTFMLVLSSINDFEQAQNQVWVKLASLRNTADKAYRILAQQQEAMHYSEIVKQVNAQQSSEKWITEKGLGKQLVYDNRFTPIGRSGEWGLSEWAHLENITILQAIEKVLSNAGQLLSFAEIKKQVSQIRSQFSDRSLRVYLTEQPQFVRTRENLYGLTAWQLESEEIMETKAKVSSEEFRKAIVSVMEKQNPIAFPELIAALQNLTGLAASSVRQRVNALETMEAKPIQGSVSKLVYCHDLNTILNPTMRQEPTQLDVKK